jgi:NCS1 family nucleobase:cation symporter-1
MSAAGGLGTILAHSSQPRHPLRVQRPRGSCSVFLPGLTAMVGFWATLSLNIPDFTRYCQNQREQLLGQLYGLPTTMLLFSFIGVAVTSATVLLYGHAIWNPVDLVVRLSHDAGSPWLAFVAMFTLAVATLSTNIAANVVGPANSIASAFPRSVSFRSGGLIAAVLGVLLCPWLVLDMYIGWLVSYSGLLGAVSGVLLADYWLLRRTRLDLPGLYQSQRPLPLPRGFNLRAIAAMPSASPSSALGYLVPALAFLAQGAWFSGVFASGAAYLVLMRGQPR